MVSNIMNLLTSIKNLHSIADELDYSFEIIISPNGSMKFERPTNGLSSVYIKKDNVYEQTRCYSIFRYGSTSTETVLIKYSIEELETLIKEGTLYRIYVISKSWRDTSIINKEAVTRNNDETKEAFLTRVLDSFSVKYLEVV